MGERVGAGVDQLVLLGGFAVRIGGVPVDPAHWRRRPAAGLVKLLALAPQRRLHREQVIDALWPDVAVAEATPRLHKAVHFARRALGDPTLLTSNGDALQLLPDRDVRVDVLAFEAAAGAALDTGTAAAIDAALTLHTGELLPDDRYEPWAEARRVSVAHLHRQLLRADGRWAELLALDPLDEWANLTVMRAHVARGDRSAALAQYDRFAAVLADEVGVVPGTELDAVRDEALALPAEASRPSVVDTDQLPPQEIRFCHARDGVRLAYATVGCGPPLVKTANWLTHLEFDWESAIWRHWLVALTSRFTLLRYDERGSGLSDWDTTTFDLEAWIEDLAAVMDAAGLSRCPLLGISQGAAVAVEYAARHPERVSALVLYGGYVHGSVARARNDEELRVARLMPQLAELGWGSDEASFRQVFTARFMPSGTKEQWDEFNELQRRTTSPTNAARFLRGFGEIDITEAAQRVRCPTLVVHVRGDRHPPVEQGRLLASLVPGSRFVSLGGENHLMLANDQAWPRFLEEVDRFLAEVH
jgi:DNA-binding SARP family transcriptional activator/pimeloyl-ACP methyl ester carboxylesterase